MLHLPDPRIDRLRAVILVKDDSDRSALQTLAARHRRDLAAEGVAVVGIGAATNIRRALAVYGPSGLGATLAGLCNLAEERYFRRGLQLAGLLHEACRTELEAAGFYVCEPDLQGELIRAVGPATAEAVIEAEGELVLFRRLQRQSAQQSRTAAEQLHRFVGTRVGRRSRYAQLLVQAVDLRRVPRPLAEVLRRV